MDIKLVIVIGAVLWLLAKLIEGFMRPDPPKKRELTRDLKRRLILGKEKATIYPTKRGFKVDDDEIRYTMLRHQYYFGNLFGQASQTPNNTLQLSPMESITPHSREHGIEAGRSAEYLRQRVISEYGIDLATMTDLEETI